MSKTSIFLTSMLLLPTLLAAQNQFEVASDTLVWKASMLVDAAADTSQTNTSEFVTYGSEKILWTQTGSGVATVFEFLVTDVNDHWNTNGYILFTTTRKNKGQSFKFERVNQFLKVTLSIDEPGQTRILMFDIDNVSPLTD